MTLNLEAPHRVSCLKVIEVKGLKSAYKIEAVKCHQQQKAMQYIPSELFSLGRSPGRAAALHCAIGDADTMAIRGFKIH